MSSSGLRRFAVLFCAALAVGLASPAFAQSNSETRPPDSQKAGDAKRSEETRRADEIAEAARTLTGPAANPECIWLGERAVNLMSRDDLDTAFRHIDLYDRFGCPGAHIQASFRCLVRQGVPDAKAADTLESRVHACWINPNAVPAAAAAAPAATTATAPAASPGTNPK
jgi:hypothetical protein